MATELELLQEQYGNDLADAHSGAGKKLNELIGALNRLKSGQATILLGNDSVTVPAADLGGDYAVSPAFAQMAFVDATATQVLSAVFVGEDLVITANATATADTLVSWFVDARD
jgi:hypothetical protein